MISIGQPFVATGTSNNPSCDVELRRLIPNKNSSVPVIRVSRAFPLMWMNAALSPQRARISAPRNAAIFVGEKLYGERADVCPEPDISIHQLLKK